MKTEIDGQPVLLRLTVDSLSAMLALSGKAGFQASMNDVMARLDDGDLNVLSELLRAELRYHHPDADDIVAGMTLDDIADLAKPIADAMMKSMPKAAPGNEDKGPLAPKATTKAPASA